MALAHRWTSRNLSRLELTAAVVIIGILMGTFMDRGLRIFAMAEQRALQASVLNINTALTIMFYQLMAGNRVSEAAQWQHGNPLELIQSREMLVEVDTIQSHPELARLSALSVGLGSRYLGEYANLEPGEVRGGQWYFDLDDATLVYRIRNTEFFQSELADPPRIRFRLELEFDDLNGDGQYNPDLEFPSGAALRPVDDYQWIESRS